jgi:hypothetical protein
MALLVTEKVALKSLKVVITFPMFTSLDNRIIFRRASKVNAWSDVLELRADLIKLSSMTSIYWN